VDLTSLSELLLNGMSLSGVNFEHSNLGGANLKGVDLRNVRLAGAGLSGSHLDNANLSKVDLRTTIFNYAELNEAFLCDAILAGSKLQYAILRKAKLNKASLEGADHVNADLFEADLSHACLVDTDLSGALLKGANLSFSTLVRTKLKGAIITGCRIYGILAWDLDLDDADQKDLIITPEDQSLVTVDNVEVAQILYLFLHDENIPKLLDTIAGKAVLILGRFTPDRKAILDALRKELRDKGYLPILFDFKKSTTRDFTETIRILAGMSLFVIADISNPRSSPLELQATVPECKVPFVPIIQKNEEPFSMFKDLSTGRKGVLDLLDYDSCDDLIRVLDKAIIEPALKVYAELLREKASELKRRHTIDYM